MIILLKDPKYIRREKWGNSFSISFNNYFNCSQKSSLERNRVLNSILSLASQLIQKLFHLSLRCSILQNPEVQIK